jgi:hypothetical protein
LVIPAAVAVILSVEELVAEFSFTVNCAVVYPVATVTLDGIVMLTPEPIYPREIVMLERAAAVSEIVQADEAPTVRVEALHVSADSATGRTIVIVAPEAVSVTEEPVGLTPTGV